MSQLNEEITAEVVRLTDGIQELFALTQASHGLRVLALVNTLVHLILDAPPQCRVAFYNQIAELFAHSVKRQIKEAK